MRGAHRGQGRGCAVPSPGGCGIQGTHPGPGKAAGTGPIPRDTPSAPHTRPLLSRQGRERRFPSGHLELGTPRPFKGSEPLPCPRGAGAGLCSLRAPSHPRAGRSGVPGWGSGRSLPAAQNPLAMRSPGAGAGCSPRFRASHTISARPGLFCGFAARSCRHGNRCSFLRLC